MIIVGLDPRVKKMMEEFFADKVCKKCDAQAERFLNGKYLCHSCSSGEFARKGDPLKVTTGKIWE